MTCPRCQREMQQHTLDGHLGRAVAIDLCEPCQSFWFDGRESLQLTPAATLSLFRVIGERTARAQLRDGDGAKCPRCSAHLRRARDMQRNTSFEYFKCPHDHGRLISFFDFLKEKNFVRPMTAAQIAELRDNVQMVNCSNCGGAVSLSRESACSHCGSPLTMLDMAQAARIVEQLRDADRSDKPVDPALPLALARARRETDAAFAQLADARSWLGDSASHDLVGAGIAAVARWLSRRVS